MTGRVSGKVAFITGAARGQGRSHAVRLAEEGADIIGVDIVHPIDGVAYPAATESDFEATQEEVERLGRTFLPYIADVRDLNALAAAASEGAAQLGHLDIVIANAGITTLGRLVDMDEHMWATMIDINLSGVWKTVKATVPHIEAGGRGGSVIFTSSAATDVAVENIGHYTAAKTGLSGLMRVLAKELGPSGIRVNTVNPGNVATTMVYNESMYQLFSPELENPTGEDLERVCASLTALPVPMVETIDIANAVLYLASDEGRYVTGTTHFVDAGERLI